MPSAQDELDGFLDRFMPEVAQRARAALAKLRKLVPGAHELVYDNYNALAIGFAPGERTSDGLFSIAVFPQWVSLFFLKGATLKDPQKRLRGGGTTVRHVVLEPIEVLDEPAIRALIAQELTRAMPTIDPKAKRKLIIKSVAAKQRPRRPTATPKKPATSKSTPTKSAKMPAKKASKSPTKPARVKPRAKR
jgi:hypothetical protein